MRSQITVLHMYVFFALIFPESVVNGLTTEVVVASYNSNSLNIIVLISSNFFFAI